MTPTPEPMDLRGRIAEALRTERWGSKHAAIGEHGRHGYYGPCGICQGSVEAILDIVMAGVQPEIDRLTDDLRWVRAELAKADAENNAAGKRAEEAEAAIDRVRQALEDGDYGGSERGDVVAEIRAALDQPAEETR